MKKKGFSPRDIEILTFLDIDSEKERDITVSNNEGPINLESTHHKQM